MGYGSVTNGKQGVITPWLGSWAQQMATPAPVPKPLTFPDRPVMPVRDARFDRPAKQSQWPIGHPPKGPK